MTREFGIWPISPIEAKIGITATKWTLRFYLGVTGFVIGWRTIFKEEFPSIGEVI